LPGRQPRERPGGLGARGRGPLSGLRNIGPKTASWLAGIGIATEAQLRRVGPVAAYRRLKHERPDEVTVICLYGPLYGELAGRHWNQLPAELKQQLRAEAKA
jgi:DNA transformation protein and related proteins